MKHGDLKLELYNLFYLGMSIIYLKKKKKKISKTCKVLKPAADKSERKETGTIGWKGSRREGQVRMEE